MKRLGTTLSIGLLVAALTIPGSLSAFTLGVDYDETVQNNGLGAVGYDYVSTVEFYDGHGYIPFLHTESWAHSLSADFMPVPDAFQVTSARLEITGSQFMGFGADLVQFAGTYEWTQATGWHWVNNSTNVFNLGDVDDYYWNQSAFEVAMTPVFDLGVRVARSVLSIDYAPAGGVGEQFAAVPEPTTLLLVGFGIVGAAGYRRFRRMVRK